MRTSPLLLLIVLAVSLFPVQVALYAADTDTSGTDHSEIKDSGFLVVPAFFYTPETRFGGGLAAIYFYRTMPDAKVDRPSSISPRFYYTQESQVMTGVNAIHYFRKNRLCSGWDVDYLDYPIRYYGIGNSTLKEDEEKYTTRMLSLSSRLQWQIVPGLFVGPRYEYTRNSLYDMEEDGVLVSGDLAGSETGAVSTSGVRINFDTRNNTWASDSGTYAELGWSIADGALGSDWDYTSLLLDLRRYFSLSGGSVFALQAYGRGVRGAPPYWKLPGTGGSDILRGYYEKRYTDRNKMAFQAEYRVPLRWNLGFVLFAGAGDVFHDLTDLKGRQLKHSIGGGLRYAIDPEERIHVRVDFGYGAGETGMYINIGEAF